MSGAVGGNTELRSSVTGVQADSITGGDPSFRHFVAGSRAQLDEQTSGNSELRSSVTGVQGDKFISGDPSLRQAILARQELLQQIETARQLLETQLANLRRSDPSHIRQDIADQGSAKLRQLTALRDQLVGGANGMPTAALRAEITSAIAATLAYTSDVRAAASGTQGVPAQQAALYEASAAADRTVRDFNRDFYERRIFDPYLKFSSATDEEAYRQREAERQREIAEARAEHTPQGELRAVNLSIAQLKDAGVHGADKSPEYKRWLDNLTSKGHALSHAIGASHQNVTQATPPSTMVAKDTVDPLTSVEAKSPDAKGAVAVLIAAGLSVPQTDNIGHGVTIQAAQAVSPTRVI